MSDTLTDEQMTAIREAVAGGPGWNDLAITHRAALLAHIDALTAAVEALNYSRAEESYRRAVLAILRGEQ